MNKKELILLLIETFTNRKYNGLCITVDHLYNIEKISNNDRLVLKDLIKLAKPNIFEKRYYCTNGMFKAHSKNCAYFWTPGIKEPRIKWLNKQLDKLDYKKIK